MPADVRLKKGCGRCRKLKLPAEFTKNRSRPDGLSCYCRDCWPMVQTESMLLRKFGITLETFNRMLADQSGGCAICGDPIGMIRLGKPLRLAVDHCHATGAVRGLLCSNCNNGIGRFKDDPELLEKAAQYLKGE